MGVGGGGGGTSRRRRRNGEAQVRSGHGNACKKYLEFPKIRLFGLADCLKFPYNFKIPIGIYCL
jgi:hypothetical protein